MRPGLASARRAISGHGSAACSLTRSAAMVEPDAFTQLLSYVEREAETLKRLRCQTLKECLLTGSVECEVWSVKCEVWSVKCEVWSVKCEVWSVQWEACSEKCEGRSGASNVTCETGHHLRRVHARAGLAGARRMQVL